MAIVMKQIKGVILLLIFHNKTNSDKLVNSGPLNSSASAKTAERERGLTTGLIHDKYLFKEAARPQRIRQFVRRADCGDCSTAEVLKHV